MSDNDKRKQPSKSAEAIGRRSKQATALRERLGAASKVVGNPNAMRGVVDSEIARQKRKKTELTDEQRAAAVKKFLEGGGKITKVT